MPETKTTPTINEELKTAAATLREMAENASAGPWFVGDCEMYPRWILSEGVRDEFGYNTDVARICEDEGDAFRISDGDWQWMGFAHPGLAGPLAAWLDSWSGIDLREDGPLPDDVVYALRVARFINGTAPQEPVKQVPPAPMCEWFRWIGQPFTSCDRCGRPAWEHQGEETFADRQSPFDGDPPIGRPWKPGEADAIRAKWEGYTHA